MGALPLSIFTQENNFDALTIVDGSKGQGKSSTTVYMAKEYVNKYSFICPKCGNEFFKNVYAVKENQNGTPIFYIPDYVKNDKAWIKCPIETELDMKTGEKKRTSGCGYEFKFSERKRIKWDPAKFIAYDNSDVIDKIFHLPTYSPIVCVAGDTKVTIRENGKIHNELVYDLEGKTNFEILSYNEKNGGFEFEKADKCILTHKDVEVYEVELENGKRIKATEDHLFYTKRGYVKLKDLTENDEIRVVWIKNFCKIKKITKRLIKENVYDIIGIKNNHNFVANSMVIHNCDEAIKFACLTDDTLISMPRDLVKYPDGVPIKDLISKKDFDIYSWNTKENRLELSKCSGCYYVKDDDVFEMELVSGEKITATADHKFVMMDGEVKKMKDLVWFYDSWGKYGRRYVKKDSNPKGNTFKHSNGKNFVENSDRLRLFFEHIRCGRSYIKVGKPGEYIQEGRFIYQQINGEVPEDFIVHHVDENQLNNNVKNLKGMDWGEHSRLTAFNNSNHEVHRNKENKIRQPKRENPLSPSQAAKRANTSNHGGIIKSIKYVGRKPVYSLVEVSKNHNYFGNNLLLMNSAFEHNKTESKELKKLFTVIRPKRFWIFFNIPSIKWIDSKYREGMASFWLRMIERGQGVLFEADKGVTQDIWHLKELEKAMGTIKFFTPMDKVKRNLMKHPCYFDMFRFPELDEKTYDEYELVRNAVNLQRQVEEQSLSNKDIAKMGAYNLLHNWERISVAIQKSRENRMTYDIMANEIFFNPVLRKRTVSDVTIRAWVRGVQQYIQTQGKDAGEFSGCIDIQDEDNV